MLSGIATAILDNILTKIFDNIDNKSVDDKHNRDKDKRIKLDDSVMLNGVSQVFDNREKNCVDVRP